jgi:glycerophosphoryl diester phosphodiesterase
MIVKFEEMGTMAETTVFAHYGMNREGSRPVQLGSLDAFQAAADRGFGLEFELQSSSDSELLVTHEPTTSAWSKGKVKKYWSSLPAVEIFTLENQHGPVCRFNQLLRLVEDYPALPMAIRLSASQQTARFTNRLIEVLSLNKTLHERLVIYGLKPKVARQFKRGLTAVRLGATVCHDYDISRFQKSVDHALLSIDSLMLNKDIFTLVWLDEWDRQGRKNSRKIFYARELVETLRRCDLKVVLTSPDLHKLHGHKDAESLLTLETRWRELVHFNVDAICTSYPARLSGLLSGA